MKSKLFLLKFHNSMATKDDNTFEVEKINKKSSHLILPLLSPNKSSDGIPLLLNTEVSTEMQEIRPECISTISN